jgi:hypothetical protein
MTLTWHKGDPFLFAGDKKIECWSKVRNEINGLRPKRGVPDLVYSMGKDGRSEYPVMPRSFPSGVWRITGFIEHPDAEKDGYLYPVYIATNAYQMLNIWSLDENGYYLKNTGEKIADYFYGLHFSNSDWTHGCLRIKKESDIRWLWANCKEGDQFIVTE